MVDTLADLTTPRDTAPTIELVTRSRVFDTNAFLRSAGVGATSETYRRSDIIFGQGDAADCVLYIQDGAVKLSVSSHAGQEGVVAMLEPGDFFGESALTGRPVRLDAATAVTATTILSIPKGQMVRVLRTDHAFSDRFIAHLMARNIRLEGDLVDHLLNSAKKRLARVLLLLARDGKPGQARRVLPPISQTTLAEIVGTTRSRVNVFLKEFKRRGFIEDDGGLKINDSLMTVVMRDDDTSDGLHRRAG